MLNKFRNWLIDRFSADDPPSPPKIGQTGTFASSRRETVVKKPLEETPDIEKVELEASLSGTIEDAGPGKNVLIRRKYRREETGTHETLTILDDSMVDSGEEDGIDPYNTGGFDRSKNWNNRFRK